MCCCTDKCDWRRFFVGVGVGGVGGVDGDGAVGELVSWWLVSW